MTGCFIAGSLATGQPAMAAVTPVPPINQPNYMSVALHANKATLSQAENIIFPQDSEAPHPSILMSSSLNLAAVPNK